ncbi:MAG: hypothetical protein P4M07_00875 [Xanthobacteraceae bacterium]|nr:hypothetical protein [Xanthobacteraceae bacterium]
MAGFPALQLAFGSLPEMADISQPTEPRPLMSLPRASWPFLLLVCAICIALDAINLVGMATDPQRVSQLACSLRPLIAVWPLNLSIFSSQYISAQCLGQASEETVSTIFLAIKLTMGVAAIPILVEFIVRWPEKFLTMRDYLHQRFDRPGGYREELLKFGRSELRIYGFLIFMVAFVTVMTTERFNVRARVLLETFVSVAIPTVIACSLAIAAVFISFALKRRSVR